MLTVNGEAQRLTVEDRWTLAEVLLDGRLDSLPNKRSSITMRRSAASAPPIN